MTWIPYLLLTVVALNIVVFALATRAAIIRERAKAAAGNVIELRPCPARAYPYTNTSTLLALPRSGRFYDSEV